MKHYMKFLALCAGGTVRSPTIAFGLKYRYGKDALAASIQRNTSETLKMLYDWADRIIIVETDMQDDVPLLYLYKTDILELGPDIWGMSLHPDLVKKTAELLNKYMSIGHY